MRVIDSSRGDFDELVSRLFTAGASGTAPAWPSGGYNVPTDVFHTEDSLVIRMEVPGVSPDDVELSVQDNTLLINGRRAFPYDAEKVRFVRRGTYYGDFTQKVTLGKGLDVERIAARYDNGVLILSIPYAAEAQPRKIQIEVGSGETQAINA
jgi:HSP20 family protein